MKLKNILLLLFQGIAFLLAGQNASFNVNGTPLSNSDTLEVCSDLVLSVNASHQGIGVPTYYWSIQGQSLTDSSLQSQSISRSGSGFNCRDR